ncbi:MAG: FTR1 family protein, partial [Bifidobacteriaceae bacterium]|nr:FTR1 family protein [Bifidobacteriaceae bacterium]
MIRKAGAVLAVMLAAVVSLLVFALPAQADTTTWHGVAEEMGGLLDKAVEQGKAGQPDDAVATVNSAYYDYYEKLGFEATVKTMVSGQQANSAEYEFTLIKRALSGGDMAGAEEHVGILKQMLLDQAEALEPGGSGPTAAGVLIQALVIILREGLEAIIVLGAIIAYLVKSGNRKKLWPVYGGALLALAASVGLAFAINAVTGLAGANQELVEGVTVLLAAGMLIWASNWVLSKSDAAAWTTYIKDKTGTSLKRSSLYSLAAVAFLAVFREGAETILLFQALRTQAGEHA